MCGWVGQKEYLRIKIQITIKGIRKNKHKIFKGEITQQSLPDHLSCLGLSIVVIGHPCFDSIPPCLMRDGKHFLNLQSCRLEAMKNHWKLLSYM